MKYVAIIALLLVLAGCGGPSRPEVPAETGTTAPIGEQQTSSSGTMQCVVIGGSGLNLRSGPTTGSAVLAGLPEGKSLTVRGKSSDDGWLKVEGESMNGWVSAARTLVTCPGDLASLPVVDALSAGTPEAPSGGVKTQLPSVGPTEVQATDAESALKRHDVPEGLGQTLPLATTTYSYSPCFSDGATPDPRVLPPAAVEILQPGRICFVNFAANQAIDVQVTQADGTVVTRSVATDDRGISQLWWTPAPGDPTGTYTVVARQPPLEAHATFMVQRSNERRIVALTESGPPGSSFRFGLAGFEANTTVGLHLYRAAGPDICLIGCWTYAATLPTARADEHGEAVAVLPTRFDDPPGGYLVVTVPQAGFRGRFDVTPATRLIPLERLRVPDMRRLLATPRPAPDVRRLLATPARVRP